MFMYFYMKFNCIISSNISCQKFRKIWFQLLVVVSLLRFCARFCIFTESIEMAFESWEKWGFSCGFCDTTHCFFWSQHRIICIYLWIPAAHLNTSSSECKYHKHLAVMCLCLLLMKYNDDDDNIVMFWIKTGKFSSYLSGCKHLFLQSISWL